MFKSTLPVPQSLLLALSFHPPSSPSISASNSSPVFVRSLYPSLLLLLLPVTLSFTISCISIHLLLLSLCSFSLFAWQKWVLTVPSLCSHPFFPPITVYSSSTRSFFGGDVKSSRNAPCKGKKKVMIQSVLLCRKDFFRLVVIHPVCRLYERTAIRMHFLPLFLLFSCSI